jgi:hypothetical protein
MRAWLRQKLINILIDDGSEPDRGARQRPATMNRKTHGSINVVLDDGFDDSPSGIDLPDPIVFKVQAVSGGTVVESKWYDHKKDEQRIKLHIITQEENLSESIGKIVTMELLQK